MQLKNAAKSSKLLLYSSKLAMDDCGDKAASKVLNELYNDPSGNGAEKLLSNSNPKKGSTFHLGDFIFLLIFGPFRFDSNDSS